MWMSDERSDPILTMLRANLDRRVGRIQQRLELADRPAPA
jgi:hypothetical protein